MLENSTALLEPLLAKAGVLTKRPPTEQERKNIEYGRTVARHLGQYDVGQTVVIAESACVAVEAMEGTDEAIARAASIAAGKPLVVVKVSKPKQDMRFDVPVIGLPTIAAMKSAGATALAIDALRTLLFDREALIAAANDANIAIQAFSPFIAGEPMGASAGREKK